MSDLASGSSAQRAHTEDVYTPQDAAATGRSGMLLFAGIVMVVGGIYHGLSGFAAVLRDQVYITTPGYTYEFDLTAWGWTHLVLGLVLAGTGIGVVQNRAWARATGIALAVLSLVANFLFLPHYPFWSIMIIVMDVVIIYGLATSMRNEGSRR
jgi:hypothetical protein